ncbi:MAG: aminotransferase class I/II-fold pyridoxal phosphate-dependent enzyme [Betaproteobacteria bacterium]
MDHAERRGIRRSDGRTPSGDKAAKGARAGDQAAAPLVQALTEYAALRPARFHMPGHKGKAREVAASDRAAAAGAALPGAGATDPDLARLFLTGAGPLGADVTELEGLDDLHAPEGPINEAQRLAALAYGADQTFFLVNGSTCGLEAAIMATCGPGDEIIVSRDTHMAVAGGLVLSGARPVYVAPEVDELYGIPLGPSADCLDAALRRHPRARAVVLTNPNYYGVAPSIKTLVAIVHGYGKIAMVDEAHGAHLPFHEALPPSALAAGADAVVSGAHKSLPAMTQASFLHLKGGALDPAAVRRMLRLIETSSPSYVLMASLDAARRVAATRGRELLDGVVRWGAAARERLSRLPGVMCLDAKRLAARGFAHDPTKLVVSFWGLRSRGVTGVEIARLLRERHEVQVELADARNILAILTMADSQADVERLVAAIESEVTRVVSSGGDVGERTRRHHRAAGAAGALAAACGPWHEASACGLFRLVPPLRMTPREAAFSPVEWVPVREACGRVAADAIVPYPPGLPVICPGEEITEPLVEFVRDALSSGAAPRLRGVRGDGAVLVVAGRPGRDARSGPRKW